jgi:hypothetical protein
VPPTPPEPEVVELDADLLEPDDTDRLTVPEPIEPNAGDLPAGLGWRLQQLWSLLRPHWLRLVVVLAPRLARARAWATRNGRAALGRVRTQSASWGRRLPPLRDLRLRWPDSWRRLVAMAGAAFCVGAMVTLPFARGGRPVAPPLAVERARAAPSGAAAAVAYGPALPVAAPARAAASPAAASGGTRSALARQMAHDAFEAGEALDGIWYFRMGLRAQRRVPGDDVLMIHTINALVDTRAADAAERLLKQLGRDARPLLAETARSHPDRTLRARARQLVAPAQPGPFQRWFQ